jgi:hypothetical protein
MSFICTPLSYVDTIKKLVEAKEASIAGAFAGTGIPVLDSIIASLSSALSGFGAAAAIAGATAVDAALQDALGTFASSALAGVVSILNVATEAQILAFAFLLDTLKRQVSLRRILLSEVQFHVEGMLNILNQLNYSYQQGFDSKMKQALPYIIRAHNCIGMVRNSMTLPKPRFNLSLLRQAVHNIDIAIGILTNDRSRALGQKFFQQVTKQNVNPGTAFKDFILASVMSQYIVLAEVYIWHLSNLVPIVVGGAAPVGYGVTDLTLGYNNYNTGTNNSIPGVPANIPTLLTQRQQRFETLKASLYVGMPKSDSTLQKLAYIDSNKGLVLTHESVKTTAGLVRNMKTNWSTLSASAKALWITLSPAYNILGNIRGQVEKYVQNSAAGIGSTVVTKAVVDPILLKTWTVTGLESVKQIILTQEQAGANFDAVARDLAVIDAIITYLNSVRYTLNSEAAIDTLLKLAVTVGAFSLTAPLNKAVMRRAIVLFTEINVLLRGALREENYLLSLLNQLNIMNNPIIGAVMKAFTDLAAQSPFGAALVGGIVSGQWTTVATTFASITTAVAAGIGTVSDLYKKITGECDNANAKTAATNEKANQVMREHEDQAARAATANENKIADTPGWWDKLGDNTSNFYMGLSL